ncbi:ABC transporter permease [Fulvimonas sp. R45]|uniref:ABC transporter permease n=1 Tax=Fulvimonas sp. R45 TaxID=3045937 RepID=UPI00265F2C80|nr:ABC transporter permease [Fulvimonas sp. R45]MDO1529496.1 ABC transporter permease [Fulvimonas sp. R45]
MNVWLAEIWRTWRASLRRPGFLLLASGVLALGIGSTVAVFALIEGALLRPLPYAQPDRLVALGIQDDGFSISPRGYRHVAGLQGVVSMGLVEGISPPVNVSGDGTPERVSGMRIDRGVLPTLGLRLPAGRDFNAEEDRPHGPPAAILGYGFWQRRYAGDPHAVGRSLVVEGVPHTIVGVLPSDRDVFAGADVVLPLALPADANDGGPNYYAVARLAPGAGIGGVAAQVAARLRALAMADGSVDGQHRHYGAGSLEATLRVDQAQLLPLFLACALFVWLIALVNLTSLMLLRALRRGHDAAVRGALGAPFLRLVLPALAESLLVGLAGALAGMALAVLGLALFAQAVPPEWLAGAHLHVDGMAGWLAFGMGMSGALLSAAIGLWRGRAGSGLDALREGGRSGTGRHSGRLGRALVVAQMALAATLLSAAGLFLHGLYDAARAPLGFSASHVLAFELAPVKADYPDAAAVHALSARVLERLRAMPGVEHVTAATNLPIGRWFNFGGFHLPGGDKFSTEVRGVEPGFLATFGIDLREGRAFARTDVRGGEAVVMVSASFAKKYFGGHALGRVIDVPGDHEHDVPARVVGVVADTHQFSALQPPPPILYLPLAQMPDWAMHMFRGWFPLRFALQVRGDPAGYRAAVHAAVAEAAPAQPIANLHPLRQDVRASTGDVRLNLLLVGVFALLALSLAAAGMYAVMAMAVAAREHEFGVRMALGASPSHLLRRVLGGGLAQIGAGLACGLGLAVLLSGRLRELLYALGRDNAIDPAAMLLVAVVLAVAGLLACLLPALRAARVAPMRALRGE